MATDLWPGYLDDFRSPPLEFKPKFRYWLPDASADVEVLRQDIREMAAVGAGGFQFLSYYQIFPQPSDWSVYGYGTDTFRPFFRAAMETAQEEGVLMDFAVAANQGQGVPAEPGTHGIMNLTPQVNKSSRRLVWEAPASVNNGSWRIMAWYERYTNQRAIDGGQNPENYVQNESWIVDHFSAARSRLMTQFFDGYIVPDQSDTDLLAGVA
ncbi:hypothetical protein Neosp_009153 [[Neocosmospora] mangrovei]